MSEPVIEPQPDGAVVVRGLSVDEVRARLIPRRVGRPSLPVLSEADIRAGIAELRQFGLPVTQVDLAAAVGCSKTRLAEAAVRIFGSWSETLRIVGTGPPDDGAHENDHRDAA